MRSAFADGSGLLMVVDDMIVSSLGFIYFVNVSQAA